MRRFSLFISFFLCLMISYAQTYDTVDNRSFTFGEKLNYHIYFHSGITGNVKAGMGELLVKNVKTNFGDNQAYHITAKGWTTGVFRFFAKVDDSMESYVDIKTLFPYQFERHIRENRYRLTEKILFDQENYIARGNDTVIQLDRKVLDLVSSLYYARGAAGDKVIPGDSLAVPFFLDDSVYTSYIKYDGNDLIETDAGVFNCKRLIPMVVVGDVFTESYPAIIWVTDDVRNIPVRIESGLAVGRVRVDLVSFSGAIKIIDESLNKKIEPKQDY